MKKILLTIVAVAITTVSFCQIKAFGDICFGMTKEVMAAEIKNNKEKYKLSFNEFYLLPDVKSSTFNRNGNMIALGFAMYRVHKLKNTFQWINIPETIELFKEIETVFVGAGYEVLQKHSNYPNVVFMPENETLLILMKKDDLKYIRIYDNGDVYNKYTNYSYPTPCFEILKLEDALKEIEEKEQNQEKLTKDINKLL